MSPTLLRILRAAPDDCGTVLAEVGGEERARLLDQLGRHGLSAIVLHHCGAQLDPKSELATGLRRQAMSVAAGGMRSRALLVQALGALNAAGVVPTPLKGVAFASRFYPDPLLRPTSDVDLLVRPHELPAAEAALVRMGLANAGGPAAEYSREHHHHLDFVGRGGMVELHFRALTGFDTEISAELLLEESQEGGFEGHAIRVLEPTRELFYLAVHAAQHLLGRLSWLYDLELLIRGARVDWALLTRLAKEARLELPAFIALDAAHRALEVRVPGEVLKALAPSGLRGQVTQSLFSEARLVEGSLAEQKIRAFLATVLLCGTTPRMARFLTHHVGRAARRKVAFRFPALVPSSWRG